MMKTVLVIGIVLFCSVLLALGLNHFSNSFNDIDSSLQDLEVSVDGSVETLIQDQTTKPFDIQVNQILDSTSYSLTVSPVVNSYELTLNSVTGLSGGSKIAFLEQNGEPHIYFTKILSINGLTITVSDPVPYAFRPVEASVFTFENQLNVDGSSTTQVFSLDNYFNQAVDITRIIFKCTDDGEMNAGLFCAEDSLTRGLVFRKKNINGDYINYFNVRNNAKWGLLAYDIDYTDNGKPPDDTYAFSSRLTYGGQSKHGVVIRLEQGESIELLVQDDLTGVSGASLMVEGHFTDE